MQNNAHIGGGMMVKRTIRTRGLTGVPTAEPQAYEVSHAALSRRAAAEGIVLLKNEGDILPIPAGTPLALYGAGAAKTIKGGTGSGDVNERYSVTICEGLKNAGYRIVSEKWLQDYEDTYSAARQSWKEEILRKNAQGSGTGVDFFTAYSTTPFYLPVGAEVTEAEAETAVYVLSRIAGENADRNAGAGDYYLSNAEHKMLNRICDLYKRVVVILNTGGVVDLSFLDEFPSIKGVLYISQPGMEGGNAVADVLSGKVSPSGKLTDTWAYRYDDYPNAAAFSHNNGDVFHEKYEEGIYVGYRFFDSFGIRARYGFGFGLSYTGFSIETVNIQAGKTGNVTITANVTNTGKVYSGKEVVQVYISLPEGRLEKEYRRLCAFGKTGELAPMEQEQLELTFSAYELASYDEEAAQWILEAGTYGIFIGGSLESSRLIGSLVLSEGKVLAQAKHICPLKEELNLLSLPAENRQIRYETLIESCGSLPAISWDLSAVDSTVYDYDAGENLADEASRIVEGLTREQMISMVTGDPAKGQGSALGSAGISVPGSAGETSTCALEQGVANIVLADGPAGLRLNQFYYAEDGQTKMLPFESSLERGFLFDPPPMNGTKYYQFCTAIPVGTMLAQTWNVDLLDEVGKMVGDEMERFGVTLWLAPGMNIHRNPLCGRNFEYYSEDPLLSGKMAAAITRGVQSCSGCGTTIKHFACNNQEDNRMDSDSIVSERALREIYLRGFGIAIREAQPMSMMTSYNLVNGIHTANSHDLCTDAARREFGFEGFIMTDWTTTEHGEDCTAARCIWAGNDLIMPGQFSDHDNIRQELDRGNLRLPELKISVSRIIRVILKSNCYE